MWHGRSRDERHVAEAERHVELVRSCLDRLGESPSTTRSAIASAARDLGEEEIARTCEQILEDERAMTTWLEKNLPMAVRETLRT